MSKAAYTAFVAFAASLLTLLAVCFLRRDEPPMSALPSAAETPAAVTPRRIAPEELALHNQPGDCWMAIHGKVYDLSAYIPKHPTPPEVMQEWCGRDASEGWDTKGYGRPHSAAAARMLERYFIGILAVE